MWFNLIRRTKRIIKSGDYVMKYLFTIALVVALAGCSNNNRSSFAQLSTAEIAAMNIVTQTRFTQAIVYKGTHFDGTARYTPAAR
jgi:uncharacterized lipoprotein YajG